MIHTHKSFSAFVLALACFVFLYAFMSVRFPTFVYISISTYIIYLRIEIFILSLLGFMKNICF